MAGQEDMLNTGQTIQDASGPQHMKDQMLEDHEMDNHEIRRILTQLRQTDTLKGYVPIWLMGRWQRRMKLQRHRHRHRHHRCLNIRVAHRYCLEANYMIHSMPFRLRKDGMY